MPYRPNKIGPFPVWQADNAIGTYTQAPFTSSLTFNTLYSYLFSTISPDDRNDITFVTNAAKTLLSGANTGIGTAVTAESLLDSDTATLYSLCGEIQCIAATCDVGIFAYLALTDSATLISDQAVLTNASTQFLILPCDVQTKLGVTSCKVNHSAIVQIAQASDKHIIGGFNISSAAGNIALQMAGSISLQKYNSDITIVDPIR